MMEKIQWYRNRWMYFLKGLLLVLLGLLALFYPNITLITLVMFYGGFAFITGLFSLLDAIFSRSRNIYWADGILEGVLGILVGFLIFFYPVVSSEAFILVLIFWAFLTGVFEIITSIRFLARTPYAWIPLINGLISVGFAVFFFFYPQYLVPAFGIYAVIFGLMMMIFSFLFPQPE